MNACPKKIQNGRSVVSKMRSNPENSRNTHINTGLSKQKTETSITKTGEKTAISLKYWKYSYLLTSDVSEFIIEQVNASGNISSISSFNIKHSTAFKRYTHKHKKHPHSQSAVGHLLSTLSLSPPLRTRCRGQNPEFRLVVVCSRSNF